MQKAVQIQDFKQILRATGSKDTQRVWWRRWATMNIQTLAELPKKRLF